MFATCVLKELNEWKERESKNQELQIQLQTGPTTAEIQHNRNLNEILQINILGKKNYKTENFVK